MRKRTVSPVISWDCSKEDSKLIGEIVTRALKMAPAHLGYDRLNLSMDIKAAHCNGYPLRLAELLATDDGNFGHDVFGISRYMDRDTGQLTDQFVPRFTRKAA